MTQPASLRDVSRPSQPEIDLVVLTLDELRDPEEFARVFYRHLFEMAPEIREMFPADMTVQNEKLLRALIDAVRALADPESAARKETELRRLGRVHDQHFKVKPEHYLYVGACFVRAVRELRAENWTSSMGSCWIGVYRWLAACMVHGPESRGDRQPNGDRRGSGWRADIRTGELVWVSGRAFNEYWPTHSDHLP